MATGKIIPRLVELRLVEALDDSPAVLIHGPRQSGKTTLAQIVGKKRGYRYFNLDDNVLRGAAERDPMGLLGACRPERSSTKFNGSRPSSRRSVYSGHIGSTFVLNGLTRCPSGAHSRQASTKCMNSISAINAGVSSPSISTLTLVFKSHWPGFFSFTLTSCCFARTRWPTATGFKKRTLSEP